MTSFFFSVDRWRYLAFFSLFAANIEYLHPGSIELSTHSHLCQNGSMVTNSFQNRVIITCLTKKHNTTNKCNKHKQLNYTAKCLKII